MDISNKVNKPACEGVMSIQLLTKAKIARFPYFQEKCFNSFSKEMPKPNKLGYLFTDSNCTTLASGFPQWSTHRTANRSVSVFTVIGLLR